MRAKQVIIVNDGLGKNLGDQAILQAMLGLLHPALPDVSIRVFPNSDLRSPVQYMALFRALKRSDLLLFGGGQEIQDHASVAFLVSGLLKLFLARLARVPAFCYAIGVGPLGTRLGRLLTRYSLNRVAAVSVRDQGSKQVLLEIGATRVPIEVTADPAVTLAPSDQCPRGLAADWPPGRGPRIVIAPRRWFHYGHFLVPMQYRSRWLAQRGKDAFQNLCRELASAVDLMVTTWDARVVLCPMRSAGGSRNPGQDDDGVCREIRSLAKTRDRIKIWTQPSSPQALKRDLGQADVVVGMRMHSLILSSMMNVPVVGLTILPKHLAFLQQIGQEDFGLDPNDLTRDNLVRTVSRALKQRDRIAGELARTRERLQTEALRDVSRVAAMLGLPERGSVPAGSRTERLVRRP